MGNFQTSDTQLQAEWVQNKVFKSIWYCSNCKDAYSIEHTTKLTPYCRNCGFKMINPQYITVEYDWGD